MPKLQEVLIATANGPRPVEAHILRLNVGARRVRFFIHRDGTRPVLSDYRSGQRVGDLGDIILASAIRWGTGGCLTERAAAQALINSLVDRWRADVVLAKLASVPQINP